MKKNKTSWFSKILPYLILIILTAFSSYKLYEIKIIDTEKRDIVLNQFNNYLENSVNKKMELEKDDETEGFSVGKAQLTMLGVLYAPSIDLKMPIYKENNNLALNEGASIIRGSGDINKVDEDAVPILTSHNGGQTTVTGGKFKNLFMNLPKLKNNDLFYIKTIDGTIKEYKINDTIKIHGDVEEDFLKHEFSPPKGDNVALRTCYPIGINSHRLILVGSYEKDIEDENQMEEFTLTISNQEVLLIIGIVIPFLLTIVFLNQDIKKKHNKLKSKTKSKEEL